jgi:thiamine biosynthesis lipoprotein
VEVDDWFIEVFNKAMDVSEQSDGAFDVTCAPLINLWGFGFRNSDSISQTAIDSILNFVGYRKIRLDGRRVIKDDPRLELNFSAIAKGFACDVIASLLERNGVQNYMVEIGGEIVVRGHNSRGQCWQIAINKPVDDDSGTNNGYADTIFLCSNSALATSGNYRNYHIRDGKKYSHTIDPKTGYPTENTLLSATIIATDCMSADAYATAFMALGYDKAMILAENIQEIDYILLVADENSKDGYRKIYKNEK